MFAEAPIGLCCFDTNLRFVFINDHLAAVNGISVEEHLGRSIREVIPEVAAGVEVQLRHVIETGEPIIGGEVDAETPAHPGLIRSFQHHYYAIKSEAGTVLAVACVVQEVTERKRAEEALQKARDELEFRVEERTSEVREINEVLRKEIAERKWIEGALHDLSARLISAQEEERSRIARELHDDFNQRLALLAVDIERLIDRTSASRDDFDVCLKTLLQRTRELSSDIHRLSHQLHPSILEPLGLVAAIRSYCKELSGQHGIHIEMAIHGVSRALPKNVALCLYRIVQEALRNVIKHSGAESARVELSGTADELALQVSDAGTGFDPESARTRQGLGLLSMRERLRLVSGTISFERNEPTGTRIDVRIPLSDSDQR